MSDELTKILPCKKHGILPSWEEIKLPAWANQAIALGARPERKLVCFKCKAEEEEARNFPEINAWNEKQK